jgi:hypothetical protein
MEEQALKKKEPYEAPCVRRIDLTPDELASSGCKSTMIYLACDNGGVLINLQSGS